MISFIGTYYLITCYLTKEGELSIDLSPFIV
jgi:hypothetical protein